MRSHVVERLENGGALAVIDRISHTGARASRTRFEWGALASPPRCELCNAPRRMRRVAGGPPMRAIAYGPSPLNWRLCKWCIRAIGKQPGGAKVEISVLFADVRIDGDRRADGVAPVLARDRAFIPRLRG